MTSEHYHKILDYLHDLFEGTQWEGHVFAVGGCCRDEILGSEIKDVDLAVNLPGGGIDLAQWLFDKGLVAKPPVTFPMFGTAMLQLKAFADEEIELVQTRSEKYTDSTRRDPTVVFGPIEADCRRRDLTINALYYDISRRKVLDILGCSIEDIHNKVIRTPDDPDATFDDDPVRILRAVRLAARYGWEIEPATFEGMTRNAARLEIVRRERMQAEVEKMLIGPNPSRAMELLRLCGATEYVMPELCKLFDMRQSGCHNGTVWEHTLEVLDKVPPMPVLRMAALLHDVGKFLCASKGKDGKIHYYGHERRCKPVINGMLRRLRYDSDFINKVIFLASNHMVAKTWGKKAENMTDSALRRLQLKCKSPERLRRLMLLIDADNRSYAPSSCMPDQAAEIMRRSAELQKIGMALFSYSQQLNIRQIRRIKGLPQNADIEPYKEFLLNLAIENPRLARKTVEKRLREYTPRHKNVSGDDK